MSIATGARTKIQRARPPAHLWLLVTSSPLVNPFGLTPLFYCWLYLYFIPSQESCWINCTVYIIIYPNLHGGIHE